MKKINQSFPGCKNMITELQTKELSLGKKYLSHTIFIAKFLIQFYVVSKYLFWRELIISKLLQSCSKTNRHLIAVNDVHVMCRVRNSMKFLFKNLYICSLQETWNSTTVGFTIPNGCLDAYEVKVNIHIFFQWLIRVCFTPKK